MQSPEDHFPLVSIITVNYNQSAVTCEMLKSLEDISYPQVEVIVVDNASPNDTPDRIKELYPGITLIKSPQNLGFAGGNNLGIREAHGKYLFFLNNDTEVPVHVMEPLVQLLEVHPDIGAVSPKIRYFYQQDTIQYAGFTTMNPLTIRNRAVGYQQPDGPEYDKPGPTHSVHGAAMMIPRSVIDKVGMMPEIYFLYYEEHDWAEMIKRAGYKIYYQPESYIFHKESVSTGKDSPAKTYYLNRNRILFARRNFSGLLRLCSLLYLTFISVPKNICVLALKHQNEHLKAYLKGIGWNLRNKSS